MCRKGGVAMAKPERDQWAEWLLSRRHGGEPDKYESFVEEMYPLRDKLVKLARITEGNTVLDVGTGDGLIAFGALDKVGKEGQVIFTDISPYLLDFCRTIAERKGVLDRCRFEEAPAEDLSPIEDRSVDVVTVRSVLIFVKEKQQAFREFHRVLKSGGRLAMFEPINSFGLPESPHLFRGFDVTPVRELAQKVLALYQQIQKPDSDPMLDFDERDLLTLAEDAGFGQVTLEYTANIASYPSQNWNEYFKRAGNPLVPTLEEAINATLTPSEAERFVEYLRPLVEAGQGAIRRAQVFLVAVK